MANFYKIFKRFFISLIFLAERTSDSLVNFYAFNLLSVSKFHIVEETREFLIYLMYFSIYFV